MRATFCDPRENFFRICIEFGSTFSLRSHAGYRGGSNDQTRIERVSRPKMPNLRFPGYLSSAKTDIVNLTYAWAFPHSPAVIICDSEKPWADHT
jgi:hypothetical protein